MKIHYVDAGFRAKGKTACGLPLVARGKRLSNGRMNPEKTEDMDRVTCKRCLAGWTKFVREGPV